MPDFTDMLSKAKEMQAKMKDVQDAIKNIEVEGEAGGNLVKVILTGDYEIKAINVSEEAKKEKLAQETNSEVVKDFLDAFPDAKLIDVTEDNDA